MKTILLLALLLPAGLLNGCATHHEGPPPGPVYHYPPPPYWHKGFGYYGHPGWQLNEHCRRTTVGTPGRRKAKNCARDSSGLRRSEERKAL
jgi:hypothetical protein